MSESEAKKRLEFGTGGLRGIMGEGLDHMNERTVALASAGLALWLLEDFGEQAKKRGVAIAYDSRNNSAEFARAAAKSINSLGIKTFIFDEVTPTPVLSFTVGFLGCAAGVVITASHNPKEYNGYKVYNEQGYQITPASAARISAFIDRAEALGEPASENEELFEHVPQNTLESFCAAVLKCTLFEGGESDKRALKAVYSPLHGSGNAPVRKTLAAAGFEIAAVPEQEAPNGDFPTVPTPNPEDKRALAMAIDTARSLGADLAFGTDPDCDRIGAAVRQNGEYELLTGNQLGALLVDYITTRRRQLGSLASGATVVKTIVTNELGAEIAKSRGAAVEDTLTGFKYIGEKITEYKKSGERSFLFGYEESYGYLIGDYAKDKDAVGAALLLCEMAAQYKKRGATLIDRLHELYREYGYYFDALDSLTLEGESGKRRIAEIMAVLRHKASEYFEGLREVKDYSEGLDGLPRGDVLKLFFEDGSWLAVRPSGTEPKIKFYYSVRADSESGAGARYGEIKRTVKEIIGE